MTLNNDLLDHAIELFRPPAESFERLIRRRDRRQRNRRVSAAVLAIVITLLSITGLMRAFGNSERPAIEPTPTPVDTGIFSGMGGWIAYGDASGIWAMDPERPGDPEARIRLSTHLGEPLAWSSDGSKLLILRLSGDPQTVYGLSGQPGHKALSVLNADGTETLLVEVRGRQFLTGGSFSPDGSKVVYASHHWDANEPSGIFLVDADGGTPRRLLANGPRSFPGEDRRYYTWLMKATFSPDGSQIAYIDGLGDWANSLRVMNADGSGSRVLLEGDDVMPAHILHLVWSPDGRRLAFDSGRTQSTYIVNADGSGLTIVANALNPHWSPDGSRISSQYSLDFGTLSISDPDGTHVENFAHGGSGPWNPLGQPEPGVGEVPAASEGLTLTWTLLLVVAVLVLLAGVVLIRRTGRNARNAIAQKRFSAP